MSPPRPVFRPSGPIVARPVMRAYPSARCMAGWPLVELGAPAATPPEPPLDFYLWELFDLDLGSTSAIVGFIRDWGTPRGVLLREPPAWESADARPPGRCEGAMASGATGSIYSWRREHSEYEDQTTVNLDEFRLSIATLHDIVRVFLYSLGILDFDDVRATWECSHEPPPEDRAALEWAAARLSWGLDEFRPSVRIDDSSGDPRDGEAGDVRIDVVGVCCLQLFNDLVSARRFLTCERCGRIFTRQRGRSNLEATGDGSGAGATTVRSPRPARYCSVRCASAASSAIHRQRARSR